LLHQIQSLPPDWRFLFLGSGGDFGSFKKVNNSWAVQQFIQTGKLRIGVAPGAEETDAQGTTADGEGIDEVTTRLLTNETFYEHDLRPAEWLYVFNSDTVICGGSNVTLDDYLEYDWITSAEASTSKLPGNNGHSLRRISSVLKLLRTNPPPATPPEEAEDTVLAIDDSSGTPTNGTVNKPKKKSLTESRYFDTLFRTQSTRYSIAPLIVSTRFLTVSHYIPHSSDPVHPKLQNQPATFAYHVPSIEPHASDIPNALMNDGENGSNIKKLVSSLWGDKGTRDKILEECAAVRIVLPMKFDKVGCSVPELEVGFGDTGAGDGIKSDKEILGNGAMGGDGSPGDDKPWDWDKADGGQGLEDE
jgi:hypothetical protein